MATKMKLAEKLKEHREEAVAGRGLGQLPAHLLDESP